MMLWSHGFANSRDKLKPLHMHYHDAYGHRTWEDRDLPWGAPTHKVKWNFDQVVLGDHVTN